MYVISISGGGGGSGDWAAVLPQLLGSAGPAVGGRLNRVSTAGERVPRGAAQEETALHGTQARCHEGIQQGLG